MVYQNVNIMMVPSLLSTLRILLVPAVINDLLLWFCLL